MKKAIFYFLIIVAAQLSNFVFGAIPAEERAALIALYNSTNGDGWYNNGGWLDMPGTEGNWYAVTVFNDHVISLTLDCNKLSGSIPSQLGNLSKLEWLGLNNNQLIGSIPSQLGNLSKLEWLCLDYN
jgi:hypothetical protein